MRADLQTFMTHSLTLITQIFNTEKGLLLCLILKWTDCFKSPVKLTTPTSTIHKFSSSGSWKRVSQSRGLALSSAEHDSGVCSVSVILKSFFIKHHQIFESFSLFGYMVYMFSARSLQAECWENINVPQLVDMVGLKLGATLSKHCWRNKKVWLWDFVLFT